MVDGGHLVTPYLETTQKPQGTLFAGRKHELRGECSRSMRKQQWMGCHAACPEED